MRFQFRYLNFDQYREERGQELQQYFPEGVWQLCQAYQGLTPFEWAWDAHQRRARQIKEHQVRCVEAARASGVQQFQAMVEQLLLNGGTDTRFVFERTCSYSIRETLRANRHSVQEQILKDIRQWYACPTHPQYCPTFSIQHNTLYVNLGEDGFVETFL